MGLRSAWGEQDENGLLFLFAQGEGKLGGFGGERGAFDGFVFFGKVCVQRFAADREDDVAITGDGGPIEGEAAGFDAFDGKAADGADFDAGPAAAGADHGRTVEGDVRLDGSPRATALAVPVFRGGR
jgi:hypothetical protein